MQNNRLLCVSSRWTIVGVGRAEFSVSVRCLLLVKIYGNNPKEWFVKIIRNNDVRMNRFPSFSFLLLRIVFISWCSLFINKLTIILFHDEINQILVGASSSPVAVLVRFNLLKPTGHVMHKQFNIQQLYALPTLYLCVLYFSENKQRLVPLTA